MINVTNRLYSNINNLKVVAFTLFQVDLGLRRRIRRSRKSRKKMIRRESYSRLIKSITISWLSKSKISKLTITNSRLGI